MTDEESSDAEGEGEEKSFRERVEEIRQQRTEGEGDPEGEDGEGMSREEKMQEMMGGGGGGAPGGS